MITVVGSSRNNFVPLDDIREQYLIDMPHQGEQNDFLNPWYCELCGLYHMWANPKENDDIVGLEHYRRYFTSGRGLLGKDEIESRLKFHDIILVSYHHPRNRTTYDWFIGANKQHDLDKWMLIVNKYEPDFFPLYYNYIFGNKLYICNMFISHRDVMSKWCEWLFPMLSQYDQLVGLGEENRRIDGYLAEHTLGAWCMWKGLKIFGGAMKMV